MILTAKQVRQTNKAIANTPFPPKFPERDKFTYWVGRAKNIKFEQDKRDGKSGN